METLTLIFLILFLIAAFRAFTSEKYRSSTRLLESRIVQLAVQLKTDNERHREKISLLEDKLLVKAGYGHLRETPIQSEQQHQGRRIVPVSEVVARTREDVVQMRVPPAVPTPVKESFRQAIRSVAVPASRK